MNTHRKPYFSPETLAEIGKHFGTVEKREDELRIAFLMHRFASDRGKEYAHHGFVRRISVLRRCIENVFELIPVDQADVPQKSALRDAEINIQAFVANCYGCIDNLAWVINFEKGLNLGRKKVGLRRHNPELRAALSPELLKYVSQPDMDKWFDYLVDYRDALAHRIPPLHPSGHGVAK